MPKPALNQSTSRTLHRHQKGEAGPEAFDSATRTPDPTTRATRSPHSGQQQPHRRHTRQETSKSCDSFSTYDIRAVLMTTAWAPTTRQTAPICSPTPLGRPAPPRGSRRSECLRCHDTHTSQTRGDTTYHPRPHAEPRTSGALSGTTGYSRPGSLASTPPTDAIERVRTQNRTGGDALGHTAPTPPVVWEQLSQSHVESCGRNNADAAASRVGCCGVGGRLDVVEGGVQPRVTWRARGSPGGGSAWWHSAGGSP